MGTRIYFTAPGATTGVLSVTVDEEPTEVAALVEAAKPFRLNKGEREIWVNPNSVAYWKELLNRSERRS